MLAAVFVQLQDISQNSCCTGISFAWEVATKYYILALVFLYFEIIASAPAKLPHGSIKLEQARTKKVIHKCLQGFAPELKRSFNNPFIIQGIVLV